jgi:hypothetical protein
MPPVHKRLHILLDTTALNQPLASFFELSLELCKALGGLDRGYLILDDVLIQRYRSGKLGLKKARDTSTGAWVFGLSLVVLAWTDGKRRIPLAFLPYFGEESKLDLALALLEWAKEAGFRPEGVLFDAWYAARRVLEWLHAHGWPFVTRLRSNRALGGVQLRRQVVSRCMCKRLCTGGIPLLKHLLQRLPRLREPLEPQDVCFAKQPLRPPPFLPLRPKIRADARGPR